MRTSVNLNQAKRRKIKLRSRIYKSCPGPVLVLRFDYQSCPGPVLGFKFCNQSCPGPVLEAKFAHQSCPGPVLGSFSMAMKKTGGKKTRMINMIFKMWWTGLKKKRLIQGSLKN